MIISLHTMPMFKKLLTTGFIFIVVGATILTISRSGSVKGPKFRGILSSDVEPPIYPKPGQEVSGVCNFTTTSTRSQYDEISPLIYLVTPTYTRREQVAELTRLGQTLLNVPNLHWVISEDSELCSPMVEALLQRFGMPYTHIISPMPKMYNAKTVKYKPRGVSSRRAAMQWVLKNWQGQKSVLYFADDDNTYDLQIFEEIRKTKRVSVFPVGFIGGQSISSPLVESKQIRSPDGRLKIVKQVVGFTDDWFASRKFPVDMAGFAVDVGFLASSEHAAMPYKAGYEEDYFLQSLNLTLEDLEPLADGCSQVLVWHTQTEKKKAPMMKLGRGQEDNNLHQLLNDLSSKGAVTLAHTGKELKICKKATGCD